MNVHFALRSKRHDKTAHRFLSELGLIYGISYDQIVPWDSILILFCELLEDLSRSELFDVLQHHRLVLHRLNTLLECLLCHFFNLSFHFSLQSKFLRCYILPLSDPLLEVQKERNVFRVLHITDLVQLDQLQIKHIRLMMLVPSAPYKELQQSIQDMSLQETNDQESAIILCTQDSNLFIQVLSVSLLRVSITIQADGIKAALVDNHIEAIISVLCLQEVFNLVCDTLDASFLHLSDDLRDEVIASDISLSHHSHQLLTQQ